MYLVVEFSAEHALPVEERTEDVGNGIGSRPHRIEQSQQMRESGLLRAQDEGVLGVARPGNGPLAQYEHEPAPCTIQRPECVLVSFSD
ncbi:hypothetical protein [Streptomyces sp. NPDC056190]|uniref:hypothetical protein n=1 Tax=Streptomyces sp. NPDC056190 TaxID=3345741 RepID=UPI0035DEBB9E